MNHALVALATQDADLLPTRLTLCSWSRPTDGFFFHPDVDQESTVNSAVNATNLSIGEDGSAVANQTINVH